MPLFYNETENEKADTAIGNQKKAATYAVNSDKPLSAAKHWKQILSTRKMTEEQPLNVTSVELYFFGEPYALNDDSWLLFL